MEYVTIHPNDTVKVCLQDGHKYARRAIRKGQPVIKYGFPIGIATADIAPVSGYTATTCAPPWAAPEITPIRQNSNTRRP